jgi:predicted esterase
MTIFQRKLCCALSSIGFSFGAIATLYTGYTDYTNTMHALSVVVAFYAVYEHGS